MYNQIKILSPQEHGFYRYTPATDFFYAKALNLIPVTFCELKLLCCDYPIVVMIQNGQPQLMLLTGVETNGAVDDKGAWRGTYVPAFLRRYPFTLVQGETEESLAIGFDLESGLFSSPEGQPLFDTEGTPTPILNEVKQLLSAFQEESRITQNILMRMAEKSLFSSTELTLPKRDGTPQHVGGFFMIDKKKLKESDDAFLLEAVKNGWMEMVELQNLSLTVC